MTMTLLSWYNRLCSRQTIGNIILIHFQKMKNWIMKYWVKWRIGTCKRLLSNSTLIVITIQRIWPNCAPSDILPPSPWYILMAFTGPGNLVVILFTLLFHLMTTSGTWLGIPPLLLRKLWSSKYWLKLYYYPSLEWDGYSKLYSNHKFDANTCYLDDKPRHTTFVQLITHIYISSFSHCNKSTLYWVIHPGIKLHPYSFYHVILLDKIFWHFYYLSLSKLQDTLSSVHYLSLCGLLFVELSL